MTVLPDNLEATGCMLRDGDGNLLATCSRPELLKLLAELYNERQAKLNEINRVGEAER